MALLFVLGVMNLVWIAALAAVCAAGKSRAKGEVDKPVRRDWF